MVSTKISLQASREEYARAIQTIPGGVNSAARAFGAVGGQPIFFAHGEGAYLYDVDGNRFIDYVGSWGPMILGHQHPEVKKSLQAAIDRGTSYGAPTVAESELAELVISMVPSVEMVRLVSSGTEATMSAIRLARGFTGRELIVKFAGNYHGHVDSLLVSAGSSAATLSVPNSPGVTRGTSQDTIVLDYNDAEPVRRLFAHRGPDIAAVIVEPICGNMGCIQAETDFLQTLRIETERSGAVLIFDEVMSGFRVGPGGGQQRLSVLPDLTTLGKIVGGGLPLAAFGGRRQIMQYVLPTGPVFQAGTLSGNPVATAAGIATLRSLIDQPPYGKLEVLSSQLEHGLAAACQLHGIHFQINRVGSMLTLFFSDQPVSDWKSASRANTQQFAQFFWGMIDQGIYWPCSQYEALFVSAAHSQEDIQTTIDAASDVIGQL